jgi:APA family basic amino acid/polyamine antiporter
MRQWLADFGRDALRRVDFQVLDAAEDSQHQSGEGMVRCLGFASLIFIVIANVIGAGIFVTTGTAAHDYAGPSIPISYAIAGILIGVPAALCYADMAGRVRGNGSAVTYAYATIGEIFAFLIGFDLLLELGIGNAAVASGWADNFSNLIHSFCGVEVSAITVFGQSFNVPAFCVSIFTMLLLLMGIREATRTTAALVAVKLLVLVVFVMIAGPHFNPQHLQPMTHPHWGWTGTVKAAAIVFFAFVGFECVTANAAECKNPQRDLPRAILWGLGICTAIYMIVSLVLVASVHFSLLDGTEKAAPMAKALNLLGCKWGSIFISFGSVVSLLSVLLVGNMGLARIARSLSRFGLLPLFLGELTAVSKVPLWSTILPGTAVAFAAALLPVNELAELCNIGTLAAFTLVCISVIVIRRQKPDAATWFRCPGYPYVPAFGAVACLTMMCFLPWVSWVRFTLWMVVALIWYSCKGRFGSHLGAASAISPAHASDIADGAARLPAIAPAVIETAVGNHDQQ